jgi:hypothetical protein
MAEEAKEQAWKLRCDYQAPLYQLAYRRIFFRLAGVYFIAMALSSLSLCVAWISHPESTLLASLSGLFGGGTVVYGWSWLSRYRLIAPAVQALESPRLEVTFDDQGCRMESPETVTSFSWRRVRELHRFADVWILCGRRTQPLLPLDTRSLEEGLRAFLERKIRAAGGRVE